MASKLRVPWGKRLAISIPQLRRRVASLARLQIPWKVRESSTPGGKCKSLIEKAEFEPRIDGFRQLIQGWEAQLQAMRDGAALLTTLSLVIERPENFARGVHDHVAEVNWHTQRAAFCKIVEGVFPPPLTDSESRGPSRTLYTLPARLRTAGDRTLFTLPSCQRLSHAELSAHRIELSPHGRSALRHKISALPKLSSELRPPNYIKLRITPYNCPACTEFGRAPRQP